MTISIMDSKAVEAYAFCIVKGSRMRILVDDKEIFFVKVYVSWDCVLLCWNLKDEEGFKGVSILRSTDEKKVYLGQRTIEGERVNLIQRFCWSDLSPVKKCTYFVRCFFEDEKEARYSVKVEVELPDPFEMQHAVFFNRGISNKNDEPLNEETKDSEEAKWHWHAKMLEKAIFKFIDLAQKPSHSLYVCAYELNYVPFLLELKKAVERGATVRVIFDCKSSGGKPKENTLEALEAIKNADFPQECLIERKSNSSSISHNKFMVFVEDGKPKKLWTGSTNFTIGGIFGQLNAGHWICDEQLCEKYLEYWKILSLDPVNSKCRPEIEKMSPLPKTLEQKCCIPLFSPRKEDDMLYLQGFLLENAKSDSMLTAAFGVNPIIQSVFTKNSSGAERFLLLESTKGLSKEFLASSHLKDRISVGCFIDEKNAEILKVKKEFLSGLNDHVQFVHTKIAGIDLFSDDPIIIFGSGNFSKSSVISNDENQIIIRGDTDVADQILVNYLRLFDHFLWRYEFLKKNEDAKKTHSHNKLKYKGWYKKYYEKGGEKERRRNLMCCFQKNVEEKKEIVIDQDFRSKVVLPEKPKNTVERKDNEYILRTARYDEKMVADLKNTINVNHRRWNKEEKCWIISSEAEKELNDFVLKYKFELK